LLGNKGNMTFMINILCTLYIGIEMPFERNARQCDPQSDKTMTRYVSGREKARGFEVMVKLHIL
jgi:hypothetical protein